MVGLVNAVLPTGTYANIAQGTYSQWAAYQDTNGSNRSLTLAMIKKAASTIATNSSVGRPDLAVLGCSLFDTLEGLFDYTSSGPSAAMRFDIGNVEKNPGVVRTAGGLINAGTGFRTMYWANQGITFVEDPDCTANTMYLLNSNAVEIEYLVPANRTPYLMDATRAQAVEQDLGPIANLVFELIPRGRTAFADQFDLLTMMGVKVKNRAACGEIDHVQ